MATGLDSIPLFAAALRWPAGRVERYVRSEREAGIIPTGQRGGGRKSAHLDQHHLAAIVMGFGGHEPSDAADATRALMGLRFVEAREVISVRG